MALFAPSAFFFVTGAAVFTIWGSSEQQDLSNNAPFGFEKHLQPVYSTLGQFKQVPAQVRWPCRPACTDLLAQQASTQWSLVTGHTSMLAAPLALPARLP